MPKSNMDQFQDSVNKAFGNTKTEDNVDSAEQNTATPSGGDIFDRIMNATLDPFGNANTAQNQTDASKKKRL